MYSTLRHDIKTLNMKVTIDGQSIEVEPGTTILQAARIGK
jgi:predicted molibdopterin-dependent oxidoreductase YjgC